MIATLFLVGSIFGHGNWYCTHGYQYPNHDLSETFHSHIVYSKDLSFSATTDISYSRISTKEIIGKVLSRSEGITEVSGETFAHIPQKVSLSVAFDNFKGLDKDQLEALKVYLLKPGKGLKIQKLNEFTMEIKHLESGTVTSCDSKPRK